MTQRGDTSAGTMPLRAHLVELRRRLFRAGVAIVVGAVAGWLLSDLVLAALQRPIVALAAEQGREASLNFTDISSAFDLRMQIALTVGIVLSSPVWLYQIWAFLVPGLKRTEKRHAVGFTLAAVPLFLAGCASGWFVLPHMVTLLTGFAPEASTSLLDARTYMDFVLKLMLAIGVAFVLPVFLVLLNFVGVLAGRSILGSWRIAVIAITLFTALATPSADVLSMFLLAVPMLALYFAAVAIALLHDRRVARRLEAETIRAGVTDTVA